MSKEFSVEEVQQMKRVQLLDVAAELGLKGMQNKRVNELRDAVLASISTATSETEEVVVDELVDAVEDVLEDDLVETVQEEVEVVPSVSVTQEQPVKEVETKPATSIYIEYAEKLIKSKQMKADRPGVSFVQKDGNGVERGIIPVNKKVFESVVKAYNGKKLDHSKLDQSLTGVDKVQMASVVYTLSQEGRVYIRSNHSSEIFYI